MLGVWLHAVPTADTNGNPPVTVFNRKTQKMFENGGLKISLRELNKLILLPIIRKLIFLVEKSYSSL